MKRFYTVFLSLLVICTFHAGRLTAQSIVYSDNFNTNTNAAYTTSGLIGASDWSVLASGVDWGARRNTSPAQLELTNDATASANNNGSVYVSTSTAAFASPYNTTLSSNIGTVTWNLNMRQVRADPSGFGGGNYGVAFILSGTDNTTRTTGTGYAVALGGSGGTDPIRLIEYTAGLATSTNIITSNTTGLTDFGAEYLSIRVIYTPASNTWELLLRNDGVTAFADPSSGVLVSQGTAINNTYTATSLLSMGAFWNGSTGASQPAFFDDVSVVLGIPAGPSINISAGVSAIEGISNGTFIINISPETTIPVTVDYDLPVPANATFTSDYGATLVSSPATGTTPGSLSATSGTITIPPGVTSITVTIAPVEDGVTEGNETITLNLSNPSPSYALGSASATINIIDNVAADLSTIQGTGSAAVAGTYTVEAIVTGIYPTLSPAGFYIQEEDADADGNINTSEGIFVVSSAVVAVGDLVRVSGNVIESPAGPSFNQAVFSTAIVTVINSNNPLPSAVDISLPVSATTDYEKFEGMIIRIPQTLTVTDNDGLGSFGEVKLSAGGLLYQPTQLIDPNDNPASGTTSSGPATNVAAINALMTANSLRTITLDDGRGSVPSLPYVDVNSTLRVGSTIDNISGILGFAFSQFRIQPIATATPVFTHEARPALPNVGAGNLKVASFNVLNYFNGNGAGGGFPTTRGASSVAEFNRQRDKIINTLSQIDADVVALIEIENLDGLDATPALLDLVNGLNDVMGAGTYSFIDDDLDNNGTQDHNTDQIRCAIIYKPSKVTPVGPAMLGSDVVFDRPPLAQTFTLLASAKNFNFVVNHFKSKNCGSATGLNTDQGDGQACYNESRRQQANALVSFFNSIVIPTSGTSNIISVGDYNANFEEDPMDILRASNYTVAGTGSSYSYLFDGMLGSLDHIVVSASLSSRINGVAKWNANSVEPSYLDYNDGVDDADISGNADTPNPWAGAYTVSPWRASDHDAIIMSLTLDGVLPVSLKSFIAVKEGSKSRISWTTSQEINTSHFIVERSNNGGQSWMPIATLTASGNTFSERTYGIIDASPAKGTNLYRLKTVDADNRFELSAIRSVDFESRYSFQTYPNPTTTELNIISDFATGIKGNIEILNLNGQSLLNKRTTGLTQVEKIDISSLPPGLYLLKIMLEGEKADIRKFIKN